MAGKVIDPVVEAILAQYEKGQEKKASASAGKKSFDLKNYFSTFLSDGVMSGSKTIRILPGIDGGTPFTSIHIHNKQIKGKFEKFVCLKNNFDKDCPFCEARNALFAAGDRELAKTFYSREYYVLRVIDRDHEDEGIKFWRISKSDYEKILSLIRIKKVDISNLETGRDITLDLQKENAKPGGKGGNTKINGIVDSDPSPAFSTKETLDIYNEDKRTWTDVYGVKSYEYLEIIVKGGEPVWSKDKECYVDKLESGANVQDEENNRAVIGNQPKLPPNNSFVENPAPLSQILDDSEDDDLPF